MSVTLDDAEISATDGQGALRGLSVGNPSGFETPRAFSLGEIKVTVDVGSVGSDPVVIKEVVIDKPAVTYEVASDGGSNIDAIRRNVEAFTGGSGGGGSDSGGDAGPKVVIENLYVRGGEVNVSATMLQGRTLSAGLPDIHLQDIGKDSGGATPGEVAEKLMASLNESIGSAVGTLNLDQVLGTLGEGVKGAQEMMEKGAGEALKSGEGMGDAAKEGLDKAGESIKKLIQ